ALGLLALFVGRYWYDAAPQRPVQFGASFSCRQVRYLGGDCPTAFAALLDDLGVRHVRLSLYWDEVEPQPGHFDFGETDALLRQAAQRGADVLLTVGIKAQRYPEVYLPSWLEPRAPFPEGAVLDQQPDVRAAALAYVEAAVQHYANDPTVSGWQVENEPFIKNFDKIRGWTISPAMTAAEVATVRAADPLQRPIVVTHSSWTVYDTRWKDALALGDVLGQNVFTKKAWIRDWWYFFPYEMGPFVPNLPGQAAAARRAGKRLWITELQAEPEERKSLLALDPATAQSISPRLLLENAALARRSGAERAYLWGAEWWYARHLQGDDGLWNAARRLIAGSPAGASAARRLPARHR
ncbi:MAG TPA: beta-galactosidase, partial [Dehalococcoidia bacterium]